MWITILDFEVHKYWTTPMQQIEQMTFAIVSCEKTGQHKCNIRRTNDLATLKFKKIKHQNYLRRANGTHVTEKRKTFFIEFIWSLIFTEVKYAIKDGVHHADFWTTGGRICKLKYLLIFCINLFCPNTNINPAIPGFYGIRVDNEEKT